MKNIIHYCISVDIQHKLNASYILQGRMCHLQQCNFNYKTFVIFNMFFLNLFLWDCQLFGKK